MVPYNTFSYIKIRSNFIADDLSRNVSAIKATISSFLHLDADDIKQKQREDSLWKRVVNYLESGDATVLPAFSNNIGSYTLFHKITLECKHDRRREVSQLIVPNVMILDLSKFLQDSPMAAHPGKDMFKSNSPPILLANHAS